MNKSIQKERHDKWMTLRQDLDKAWKQSLRYHWENKIITALNHLSEFLKFEELRIKYISEDISKDLNFQSNVFLISDLPTDYITLMTDTLIWEFIAGCCYLEECNILRKKVYKDRMKLPPGTRIKEKNVVKKVNEYLEFTNQISEFAQELSRNRGRFYTYLDVWNSNKQEDIFLLKELSIENVNQDDFLKLKTNLINSYITLKDYLIETYGEFINQIQLSEDTDFVDEFIDIAISDTTPSIEAIEMR